MRPRSLYSRSSASPDDAPVLLAPYRRWSRTGSEGYRNGVSNGCAFDRALSRFPLKSRWTRFALRASVVLALLFTTHLLLAQRNQALVSASAENKDTISIRHGAHHHHRARARARRGGFFRKTSADSRSNSDEATAAAAAVAATTATTATTTQAASSPSPSSSLAKMSALGGELVQKNKPASLVIVVPFTSKDAEKVVNGLRKWARPGDPCPAVRRMQSISTSLRRKKSTGTGTNPSVSISTSSPVDVLFWFNRDLDDIVQSRGAFKENFLKALKPISHCFNRVEFKSARLSEEEDAYPFGPSNQWYDLFLSSERPLANYDYAFWCEHDVMPVQPGWVDALLREATFSSVDFFVKGSLHRGRKLDDIVPYPDEASWVGHINGNALYKANDPTFLAMISQCREANRGSMSFTSSFDTAMWIQHVTSYASRWEHYQNYAHKFQYTDLIQNLCRDVSWPDGARELVGLSPRTFLVHGSLASAGEEHRKKTFENGVAVDVSESSTTTTTKKKKQQQQKKLSPLLPLPDKEASSDKDETDLDDELQQQLPFRPKAFLPPKVAVVIPLITSQIEKLRVLFSLSSKEAFRPCNWEHLSGDEDARGLPIDLVFQISSTWLDDSGTDGNEAYHSLSALVDEYPRFTSCFDKVHTRAAHLMPSEDIHTAYVFTGPNLQFRRMMNDSWLRYRFSHVLLLEPDATPIKHDWLERLWVEARGGGEGAVGVITTTTGGEKGGGKGEKGGGKGGEAAGAFAVAATSASKAAAATSTPTSTSKATATRRATTTTATSSPAAAATKEESFWIKGTAYRGFRGDWVRNPAPYNITKISSMWAAMNGNGIYNLQDPEFYEFMDRVWEAHPDLPFDGALHAYLFDVDNFEYTKRALTKIRYSSYVQNHGATRFDVSKLRRESPETYIVHSSCRDEFPNKKTYCFVCDRDTPWSEECQVKLNSDDISLDYDRYTMGPTYRGPEISNANAQELWKENIVL